MDNKEKQIVAEQDLEEIMNLIDLPEEQFVIVAPLILEEVEKSISNPHDRMLFTQLMNSGEISLSELQNAYDEVLKVLDDKNPGISSTKKDFLKRLFGTIINGISETEGIAKRVIKIPLEKCHPDAKTPTYAHLTDSGMDVYALEDITINPGETIVVPTGLKVAIPAGYELQVRPKSGRALKTKLRIANTPGTIDAGYRDEIGVIIENVDPPIRAIHPKEQQIDSNTYQRLPITIDDIEFGQSYTIGKGEKFAQLVLAAVPKALFYEVESVDNIANDGRNGGYGSTGIK